MNYDQLKKIIESCHLNFLIGSGASQPYLATLGNIEQDLTEVSMLPDGPIKTAMDASLKNKYFLTCIKGNAKITTDDKDDKLVATKDTYRSFLTALYTVLLKRRTNLVSKQVNLFTTNMDLFIEYTLEANKIEYNDGFSGRMTPKFGTSNFHNIIHKVSPHYENQSEIPLMNVFKLHGSVNWRLSDDSESILYDSDFKTISEIDSLTLEDKYLVSNEKEFEKKKIKDVAIHEKFIAAYNKLVMINPTKEKFKITTKDLTFYELLRMYSNHLERENSVLFVIGFSFADEHIREITKRVAKSNPTLLIVIYCYSKSSRTAIEEKIGTGYPNVIFIADEAEKIKYSLSKVNEVLFTKLATELTKGTNELQDGNEQ